MYDRAQASPKRTFQAMIFEVTGSGWMIMSWSNPKYSSLVEAIQSQNLTAIFVWQFFFRLGDQLHPWFVMLNLQRFNACGSRPNHSMSPTSPDDVLIPVFCFVLLLHHFCQVCQIWHENKHEWMVPYGLKWLICATKEWCVKSKDIINAYNIYAVYINTFTSTLKSPKGWWIDTLYRNHLAPFWRSRLGIHIYIIHTYPYMVVWPHPTNRKYT